ncbi:MAG: cobyrinic acid a,c-diamide synthase, partial [Burkholderiales bacterium]|nr:cobyrinic acid a,c-diamide synthase [Burkholderiales bacterium]
DLAAVLELAGAAPRPAITLPAAPAAPRRGGGLRIGVARDKAFGFYYPDDLRALEAEGATLVPLDTLADAHLPALDGLFIGGGFPELFMAELEANVSLRTELHRAIVDGLPVYAECGGLMYLARTLNWNGRSAQMVGVIAGDAVMHERPVGRGYVRMQETAAFPWPGGGTGTLRLGHEFHHSSLENLDLGSGLHFAYRVQRGQGLGCGFDGIRIHNVLASYMHQRHCGGNDWPRRFMAFVREVRGAQGVEIAASAFSRATA